jgi:hypothetical protein
MDLLGISGWVELDVPDHIESGTAVTLWCVAARADSSTIGFTAYEIEFFEEVKRSSPLSTAVPTPIILATMPHSLTRGFR